MRILLLTLLLVGCSKSEDNSFKMPFGKSSSISVTRKANAPASLKEYKTATALGLKKK